MNEAEKLITIANNTPAVAEAVNAAKTTVSGSVVRADDVLDVAHSLQVQLKSDSLTDFSGASVTVYGKNLVDYTKATGRDASQKVEIVDGGVLWKAGGDFYFEIPLSLPAGISVVATATGENAAGENLQTYTLVYEDNTYTRNDTIGYSKTAEKPVIAIRLYKYEATTALSQDLLVTNIQLELGAGSTDYEPYKAPQTATADASGKVMGLSPIAPTMTLLTDTEGVKMECSYFPEPAADTYAKYQELKQEQINLQDKLQKYLQEESTDE